MQATTLSSTHSYHALGCSGPTCSATCDATLVLLHLAKDVEQLHQVQATTIATFHSYLASSSGGATLVLLHLAEKDTKETTPLQLLGLDSVHQSLAALCLSYAKPWQSYSLWLSCEDNALPLRPSCSTPPLHTKEAVPFSILDLWNIFTLLNIMR